MRVLDTIDQIRENLRLWPSSFDQNGAFRRGVQAVAVLPDKQGSPAATAEIQSLGDVNIDERLGLDILTGIRLYTDVCRALLPVCTTAVGLLELQRLCASRAAQLSLAISNVELQHCLQCIACEADSDGRIVPTETIRDSLVSAVRTMASTGPPRMGAIKEEQSTSKRTTQDIEPR